jgi:ribonuclease HI
MTQPSFHIVKPGHYKVMHDSQVVGRMMQWQDGRWLVRDIRQETSDKVYAKRDEAFMHFLSFNWSSVVGRSSLATIDNRVIKRNQHLTQRWAMK